MTKEQTVTATKAEIVKAKSISSYTGAPVKEVLGNILRNRALATIEKHSPDDGLF